LVADFDNFSLAGRTSRLAAIRVHVKPKGVVTNGLIKLFFAEFCSVVN
jgi:hypothetical protein